MCKDTDVLARTIYGEARGESLIGKEAIARVILNRRQKAIDNGGKFWWGNEIAEICQKSWQFSCWNKNDPNYEKLIYVDETDEIFKICKRIAKKAVSGIMKDFLYGATHYHTKEVFPKWSIGKVPCIIIGNHHFYNDIA